MATIALTNILFAGRLAQAKSTGLFLGNGGVQENFIIGETNDGLIATQITGPDAFYHFYIEGSSMGRTGYLVPDPLITVNPESAYDAASRGGATAGSLLITDMGPQISARIHGRSEEVTVPLWSQGSTIVSGEVRVAFAEWHLSHQVGDRLERICSIIG